MSKKRVILVSMGNLHFFRWCELLNNKDVDYYWFDVLDGGCYASRISHIKQIYRWKLRYNYPMRHSIKIHFPGLYRLIGKINDRSTEKVFESLLEKIKPDLVHSFELFIACDPISEVMANSKIPWMYSSWGSDVFYAEKNVETRKILKNIIRRIDYLITDCNRDFELCREQGFVGSFMGVIPGGTGIDREVINVNTRDWFNRDFIIVKGYQGKYGRCIEVIKALNNLSELVYPFQVVVFFAHDEVKEFIDSTELKLDITYNNGMLHHELLSLMEHSWMYIGNSISDGIPNTLIEAALCGCIPVQSNPGNASAELIEDGFNGFLIDDAEDIMQIENTILRAIAIKDNFQEGLNFNTTKLYNRYDRKIVKNKINEVYNIVLND